MPPALTDGNPSSSPVPPSSITRSFRFSADMVGVLDEEAERMGISVNALVGTILRRYAEFTRYLSKVDMVVVNREVLTSLLDSLEEDEVYRIGAKLGQTVLPDTVIFWKKELTDRAVTEYIEKVMCRYGHLGTYDEMQVPGSRTMVIRHRLGRKGSRFLEGFLQSGLKHTLGVSATFEITGSSVKCEMPRR